MIDPMTMLAAEEKGRQDALELCIAYLMAEHCRQDADPRGKASQFFEYAKQFAARNDARAAQGTADQDMRAYLERSYEAQHQMLATIHRDTEFLLEYGLGLPPPSPPGTP